MYLSFIVDGEFLQGRYNSSMFPLCLAPYYFVLIDGQKHLLNYIWHTFFCILKMCGDLYIQILLDISQAKLILLEI